MASWIHKNPDKGAFRGLITLGFNIKGRPEHWTKAAFQVVLNNLATTLTLEDHKLIIFGVIFVEHILCKVVRFDHLICSAAAHSKRRLKSGGLSLKCIAEQLVKDNDSDWTPGANLTDTTGKLLPIPLRGNLGEMEALVRLWA